MAENITRQSSKAGKILDKIFGKKNAEEKKQLTEQQDDHNAVIVLEEQKDENKLQTSTDSDSDQVHDFYIVQVNSTSEPNTNSNGESAVDEQEDGDEKIPKEDAVCKLCFVILSAGETIMQTNCSCKKAYIHEACSHIWSTNKGNKKCDVCEEEVKDIRVRLVEPHGAADSTKVQKKHRGFMSAMLNRKS